MARFFLLAWQHSSRTRPSKMRNISSEGHPAGRGRSPGKRFGVEALCEPPQSMPRAVSQGRGKAAGPAAPPWGWFSKDP